MADTAKVRNLQGRARDRGLHGRVLVLPYGRRMVCTRELGHEGGCDGPYVDCECRRCENERTALGLPGRVYAGDAPPEGP